jgi:hypothetical protein
MDRHIVVSSNLKLVGYDEKMNILEIEFHSGAIYQYSNVPSSIYVKLMNAPSKGTFHHQQIKDKFKYIRLR